MKLKKMQKLLKNAGNDVKVEGKKKTFRLADTPEEWGDKKIKDAYQGKDGLTLVVGGKDKKKKVDDNDISWDIDDSIAQLQKELHISESQEYDNSRKKANKKDYKDDDRRKDRKEQSNGRFRNNNPNRKPANAIEADDSEKFTTRSTASENEKRRALDKAGISTDENKVDSSDKKPRRGRRPKVQEPEIEKDNKSEKEED
jgi:hypothetical protein